MGIDGHSSELEAESRVSSSSPAPVRFPFRSRSPALTPLTPSIYKSIAPAVLSIRLSIILLIHEMKSAVKKSGMMRDVGCKRALIWIRARWYGMGSQPIPILMLGSLSPVVVTFARGSPWPILDSATSLLPSPPVY
ncbi:unnamed protein product [Urochloa humidicola]